MGCHCNAGGCQKYLQLGDADIRRHHALGKVCGDDLGLIDGRATGMVRISFGALSTLDDVDQWIRFLREELLDLAPGCSAPRAEADARQVTEAGAGCSGRLVALRVFPIKGCGPLRVKRWPIDPKTGALLLDRRWCLTRGERSRPLGAKQAPRLAAVTAGVEGLRGAAPALVLRAPGAAPLRLPLPEADAELLRRSGAELEPEELFPGREADPDEGPWDGGATRWFEAALVIPGLRLLEAAATKAGAAGESSDAHFANAAGTLLLVSRASLVELGRASGLPVGADRFRANLEADLGTAFAEEALQQGQVVRIGSSEFTGAGPCVRCQAIDVEPGTGTTAGPSLLASLATVRRPVSGSAPVFGSLLRLGGHRGGVPVVLAVGEPLELSPP